MQNEMKRIGVVGAGLIGGSICKSLRQAGLDNIAVFSQSESTQSDVRNDGFRVVPSIADLVAQSGIVFVCVPLNVQMAVYGEIADAITSTSRSGIVITDVSSVKGVEARTATELFSKVGAVFVPGHPMAGTEFTGFKASTADMFHGATWVLCPEGVPTDVVGSLTQLVLSMGAKVSLLDIESHDAAVGAISHLPYVVAATLANVVGSEEDKQVALQLAAGSFRDGTRVAGSEPWLSTSMVTFNRVEVLRLLTRFQGEIEQMVSSIQSGDDEAVLTVFQRAQNVRRDYEAAKSSANQRSVQWDISSAVQNSLHECRGGGLIRELSVDGNGWTVAFEG